MNKTILVVDDSATLWMSVEMTLESAGYEVVHAINWQKRRPGAATPGRPVPDAGYDHQRCQHVGHGRHNLHQRGEEDPFTYLPILVLTTEREYSKKLEGKQAGVAGWLVKPLSRGPSRPWRRP